VNVTGIDLTVIDGQDLAGSDQTVAGNATDLFNVDTDNPIVTNLSNNLDSLSDDDAGTDVYIVTIDFSENMSTIDNPLVTFIPDISAIINNADSAWNSSTQFSITFDVTDDNASEIDSVDIQISSASDLSGNPISSTNVPDTLFIDMAGPVATSISASLDTIALTDIGTKKFYIRVDYNEQMDTFITPDISFLENLDGQLTDHSTKWMDDSTFIKYYNVVDNNKNDLLIDVKAIDAEDIFGNIQPADYTELDVFNIIMKAPVVTDITVDPDTINESHVGVDSLLITITFNERMDQAIDPVLVFTPAVSSLSLSANSDWISDEIFEAYYDITDDNATIDSIDIQINTAENRGGNLMITKDTADLFSIDLVNPVVSSLTMNHDTLSDTSTVFIITVNYTESMDQAVNPAITFSPNVKTNFLSESSLSWTAANQFTAEYSVSHKDSVGTVDINVANALDSAGNTQVAYTATDTFLIEMVNPLLTTFVLDPDYIGQDDAGTAGFKITINFSEVMDTNTWPVVQYPEGTPSCLTANDDSSYWVDDNTFIKAYNVTDNNLQLDNIDIRFTTAVDLAGNAIADTTFVDTLGINLSAPNVTSVRAIPDIVSESDTGNNTFRIQVSFDKQMSYYYSPSITFPTGGEQPASITSQSDSGWINRYNYTAYFDVSDENEDIDDIDIFITGARYRWSSTFMNDHTEYDLFRVDMVKPLISTITPLTSTITNAYVGNEKDTITVVFTENMNTAVKPDITYPTTGEQPTTDVMYDQTNSIWSNDSTFLAVFDVVDNETNLADIDIQLSTAEDSMGNVMVDTTVADLFSIDTEDPLADSLVMYSNNAYTDSLATVDDSVTIVFETSEVVQSVSVTLDGNVLSPVSVSGDTLWRAKYQMQNGDTEGKLAFIVSFDDLNNNASGNITWVTIGDTVEFDETVVTFVSLDDGDNNNYKKGETITFDIDLNEPLARLYVNPSNLDASFSDDQIMNDDGDGTYSFTTVALSTQLNEGVNIAVQFYAYDRAGNGPVYDNSLLITIDSTAPANQDAVFTGDTLVNSNEYVFITSSGEVTNQVWFAPDTVTVFVQDSSKTKASSGLAELIRAPKKDGIYKLFIIDASGNVSDPSTAILTVDDSPPVIDSVEIISGNYKVGDSIDIVIYTDTTGAVEQTVTINSKAVIEFTDNTDKTYSARYVVQEGDDDRANVGSIPVSVTLSDAVGNTSSEFTGPAITTTSVTIDANSPNISSISIPNQGMKIGDTVWVSITVDDDGGDFPAITSGTIGGFALDTLIDSTSTTYGSRFVVTNSGVEYPASSDIPVNNLVFTDAAGNISSTFSGYISQGNDTLDAKKPVISNATIPNDTAKIGDVVTATITVGNDGGSAFSFISGEIGAYSLT
ncbi:hypothetical protein ACFLSA_06330, partial [Bacteroidota bacterium]